MEREELIRSEEYWITNIQIALFELIRNCLKENKMTQTQLAEKLGVTKGYITQVLNGDFDHKISKLVELSLACNVAPVITFVNIDDYIANEIRPTPKLMISEKSVSSQKKELHRFKQKRNSGHPNHSRLDVKKYLPI